MSPPRGDPGSRRAAILDAALRLFGQYGYRRTSMDDIAREAEIAKGTIYLSFSSKDDVFRALSEDLVGRMLDGARAAKQQPGSMEDRLVAMSEAWFGSYFETIHRSPHADELMDSKHRLSSDLVREASEQYRRLVGEVLEDAVGNGELRLASFNLGADAAAELLIAAAKGLESSVETPAEYHRRLAELVRVVVAGLRAGVPQVR
jgi:TetR/AcrR family transcriptional regulator, regulator of autoinduction and epiphytic fitness